MARKLPIQNGRLTTDLDANGFKIKNLPPGSGFTQAQADWSQTDSSAVDFIKNKPTIPSPTSVDPTLSVQGAAADAKATGDALAGKRGIADLGVRGVPYVTDAGITNPTFFSVNGTLLNVSGSMQWSGGGFSIAWLDENSFALSGSSVAEGFEFSLGAGFTYANATYTIIGYVDTLAKESQLAAKAPLASPALTGTPTAPTAPAGTNTTQVATTAFVKTATDAKVDSQGGKVYTDSDTLYVGGDMPAGVVAPAFATLGNWGTFTSYVADGGNTQTLPDYITARLGVVRYDLPANATAITTASSEVVEGETVTYGAATLADRTGNRVSITATIDELRVTFPPAVSGKLRDFGLRVEVGTGSAALTAPALVPVAPTGETIKLENSDGAIPPLADGTADAKGVTLLYFSETAPGVFLVNGEQVEEVA